MIKDANWQQFIEPSKTVAVQGVDQLELFEPGYARRGFLPEDDPLTAFPRGSRYAVLDELGRDLPSLLEDRHFRTFARDLEIPPWQGPSREDALPLLRLYYLRLGFLASAYINHVGDEPARLLPANIAQPLVTACKLLQRPPILSYDGYALYTWKRFCKDRPVALGNIDTLQNFVHLYDEHWFILVHVEIEAIAADILAAIARIKRRLDNDTTACISEDLWKIEDAVRRQVGVLRRIPEKMDPALYFKTFRPYIRFFENVVYQGVDQIRIQFRGETGAQSSIMPILVAFLKIPHQPSALTNHLADMRNYMPSRHRTLIDEVAVMPNIRGRRFKEPFNAILDAVADFRRIHYGWADDYIHRRTPDPLGTGGTPYMHWLDQMIRETETYKI